MDKIEVTQADRTLYHQLLSLGSVNLNRRRMGLPIVDGFELIAAHRLATLTDATPVAEAWAGMEAAMQDPDYAWGWHCNLAMPIMDATGITHEQANMAAAHLMQHLWKCDITTHPHYQYEKSGAQSYAEFRIEADKAEDAALPDATHPPATDVAALVEAAKDALPFMTQLRAGICLKTDGKIVSADSAYQNLYAALAPFTKGQNDE